jgi:hypothetical protein
LGELRLIGRGRIFPAIRFLCSCPARLDIKHVPGQQKGQRIGSNLYRIGEAKGSVEYSFGIVFLGKKSPSFGLSCPASTGNPPLSHKGVRIGPGGLKVVTMTAWKEAVLNYFTRKAVKTDATRHTREKDKELAQYENIVTSAVVDDLVDPFSIPLTPVD